MAYAAKQSRRVGSSLPAELPNPATEQENGVPEGAVWEIEEGTEQHPKGTKFRLTHKRTVEAQWVPVLTRAKTKKNPSTK